MTASWPLNAFFEHLGLIARLCAIVSVRALSSCQERSRHNRHYRSSDVPFTGSLQDAQIKVLAVAVIFCRYHPGALFAKDRPATPAPLVAVGPQYDIAHVYVAPADLDRFTASLIATFGGTKSQPAAFTVTPTPSETNWRRFSRRSARSRYSASRRRFPIRLAPSGRAIS